MPSLRRCAVAFDLVTISLCSSSWLNLLIEHYLLIGLWLHFLLYNEISRTARRHSSTIPANWVKKGPVDVQTTGLTESLKIFVNNSIL